MKKILGWALVMTVIIAGACDDDGDNNSTTNFEQAERDFVAKASEANLAEIELGQMAASKASTAGVQSFGSMMMTEHQMALDELETIATDNSMMMATELNAEHQQLKDKLTALTGIAFDTAYMNSQVKDHQKTLTLFQQQANGRDGELKTYANKYLPHIQMHLEKADSIQNTFD